MNLFSLQNLVRGIRRRVLLWNLPQHLRAKKESPLDADQQEVQNKALKVVYEDRSLLMDQYFKMFGNILDADRAKEMFGDYTANAATRARFSSAVYEPAQKLVDIIYDESLRTHGGQDLPVVFLAGGPGSGKSTFIETAFADHLNSTLLIMDGTLSQLCRAIKNIDKALDAGCLVSVVYIHRNFEDAVWGAIDRARNPSVLRAVPMKTVALKHYAAVYAIRRLTEYYRRNDRVAFSFFRFPARAGGRFTRTTINEVWRSWRKLDIYERDAHRVLHDYHTSLKGRGEVFPESLLKALKS